MNAPAQPYPLQWPEGIERTASFRRQKALFSEGRQPLNAKKAIDRLTSELRRYQGKNIVVSSNVTMTDATPADPGVAVYFIVQGEQRCVPCDRWTRVPDNIAAIAKALEALRKLDLWVNSTTSKAAFRGFSALPAPASEAWRQALGLAEHSGPVTADTVVAAHRRLSMRHHPDRGGDPAIMAQLNAARDAALEALKHG